MVTKVLVAVNYGEVGSVVVDGFGRVEPSNLWIISYQVIKHKRIKDGVKSEFIIKLKHTDKETRSLIMDLFSLIESYESR